MRCLFFLLPHTRNLTRRVEPAARLAGFAFAARRSESDSRSEAFSRRRACEYSRPARNSRTFSICAKRTTPVRISRPKVGKRLAQRGIFQTQGEDILAKGEIPVFFYGE